jgi:hypothetical protein
VIMREVDGIRRLCRTLVVEQAQRRTGGQM